MSTAATRIDNDEARIEFLPKHFPVAFGVVESAIFFFAKQFIEGYNGGMWAFYETPNGAPFLVWGENKESLKISTPNGEETCTPMVAGIIITLYALSNSSFSEVEAVSDETGEKFHQLRDYVRTLPDAERNQILRAID